MKLALFERLFLTNAKESSLYLARYALRITSRFHFGDHLLLGGLSRCRSENDEGDPLGRPRMDSLCSYDLAGTIPSEGSPGTATSAKRLRAVREPRVDGEGLTEL